MNKIHELEFPLPKDFPEKKQVQYLYIDADEDGEESYCAFINDPTGNVIEIFDDRNRVADKLV